jgi:hypothetical protein
MAATIRKVVVGARPGPNHRWTGAKRNATTVAKLSILDPRLS